MNALKIILLCVGAAVSYGVAHDLITAHLCVEYFTIGHPRIFDTESPTLLALGWGVVATWWVGALLGLALAIAATRGPRVVRSAGSLVGPIAKLLAWMGGVALIAGVIGYALARNGAVILVGHLASEVPSDRHVAFLANLWAHTASYGMAFVGGILLDLRVWRSRRGPLA
ncbi:MAG: hypothetical protein IPH13_15285 [Planctomycetes bacterium]|nr:hypothetical protein [Planctomycetota bacterium]